jgi:steroid delta-isomerase
LSIKVLLDGLKHPARDMAIRSIRAVEGKDRESWLGMWAEDGVLEDPVGISPLDPEGRGHRGIDAITSFHDRVIIKSDLRFWIRHSYACGNECANVGTITAKGATGHVSRTELVMIYRLDAEGRLASLRAFWEFDDMLEKMF